MEKFSDYGRNSIIVFVLITLCWITTVHSLNCFECVSINGTVPACTDPFYNNQSLQIQQSPCQLPEYGSRLSLVMACIKIAGVFDDTGETIAVRGCGIEDRPSNNDTLIGKVADCENYYHDGRLVHGCIHICNDVDGCNNSNKLKSSLPISVLIYQAYTFLKSLQNF